MKTVKNSIIRAVEKMEKEVIKRENYFSSRSENWQESENAASYLERTEQISDSLSIIKEGLDLLG